MTILSDNFSTNWKLVLEEEKIDRFYFAPYGSSGVFVFVGFDGSPVLVLLLLLFVRDCIVFYGRLIDQSTNQTTDHSSVIHRSFDCSFLHSVRSVGPSFYSFDPLAW